MTAEPRTVLAMRSTALVLGVLVAVLAAAPARAATIPSPATPDTGVRTTVGAHTTLVRFTGASGSALRRVAGRRLRVECGQAADPQALAGMITIDQRVVVGTTAPRRGAVLRIRSALRGFDFCAITTAGKRQTLVAIAGLTPPGLVWIDEFARVGLDFFALSVAQSIAGNRATTYPPADRVVAKGLGLIVALDGPDASPPPDKVGYWTDGARHVVVAALSRAGRRIFFEDEGGGVVRGNVDAYFTALGN